ncbi:MAG: hypothetical protein CMJ83_16820 [Planctomycetes bacterium]|nr:hypothetical protein [Planctomycetota bacterium]
MNRYYGLALLVLGLSVTTTLIGQPPIQLNTTVRSTTLTGSGMADLWTFIDSQGREFALICQSSGGMSAWEITNPATPVFADNIPTTGSDLKDIKIEGNYGFICQESGDGMVVDLTDPYNLNVVATVPGIGAHNGEVGDGYWVFCSVPGGSQIWDISNPLNPFLVSTVSGSSHDATIDGDRLYIHSFSGTQTHVYDISNIASPQLLSSIPYGNHSGATYTAPGGQRIVMVCNETGGGYSQIWDVTDGSNPVYLSSYQTPGWASISVHNPVEMGRYICISHYADFLRIVDVANPSTPQEVGIFDPVPNNAGAGLFSGCWGAVPLKELAGGGHRIVVGNRNTPVSFYVIDFTPPPAIDLAMSTTGAGDLDFTLSGVDPFTTAYNLISVQSPILPFGSAPFLGIGQDAFFLLIANAGAPIQVATDAQGQWSISLPAGAIAPGFAMDVVSLGLAGGQYRLSPVGRIGF